MSRMLGGQDAIQYEDVRYIGNPTINKGFELEIRWLRDPEIALYSSKSQPLIHHSVNNDGRLTQGHLLQK